MHRVVRISMLAAATVILAAVPGASAVEQQPAGEFDTTFGTDGRVRTVNAPFELDNDVRAIAPHGNGTMSVLVTGYEASWIGQLLPDGSLDATFGDPGNPWRRVPLAGQNELRGMARQADGKYVLAGTTYHVFDDGMSLDATSSPAILRLHPTGEVDHTWAAPHVPTDVEGRDFFADAVAISGGKTYIAGNFRSGRSTLERKISPAVVRLSSGGALDPTFDGDGVATLPFEGRANGLAVQPDGRAVVAGTYRVSGRSIAMVARLTTTGAPDPTFSGDGILSVSTGTSVPSELNAVAVQRDGRIVAAGNDVTSTGRKGIALRLFASGDLDPGFDSNGMAGYDVAPGHGEFNAVGVQADGRLLLGGNDGQLPVLLRVLPNGATDTTFSGDGLVDDPFGKEAVVQRLQVQPDGKPVALGWARSQFNHRVPMAFRVTEPLPAANVLNASAVEGNDLIFTVKLSKPSLSPVTLTLATSDGTATAGLDYDARTANVVIPAGSLSAGFAVSVRDDTLPEPNESLFVAVTSASGAVTGSAGLGTIVNDDSI